MLRVTVEVVPGGDETRARIIDRVTLVNKSGLADVSDYLVSSEEAHKVATVRGHRRSDGWAPLVRRALETLWPDKMPDEDRPIFTSWEAERAWLAGQEPTDNTKGASDGR